ncbi:hypothetical protein STEG23_003216 [Scotinomys teguina]
MLREHPLRQNGPPGRPDPETELSALSARDFPRVHLPGCRTHTSNTGYFNWDDGMDLVLPHRAVAMDAVLPYRAVAVDAVLPYRAVAVDLVPSYREVAVDSVPPHRAVAMNAVPPHRTVSTFADFLSSLSTSYASQRGRHVEPFYVGDRFYAILNISVLPWPQSS